MRGPGFGPPPLVVVVGLVGPLLASIPHLRVPVVVGELLVGIVLGRTGFGIIDDTNPTLVLLANVGFALVMFVVGPNARGHTTTCASPSRGRLSAPGGHPPRCGQGGRVCAGGGARGDRGTAPARPATVRDHRGPLWPAVLRLA